MERDPRPERDPCSEPDQLVDEPASPSRAALGRDEAASRSSRLKGGRSLGSDPVGWFVRRAGLARFATFACALGLVLSAVGGPRLVLALAGLMLALLGALAGCALRPFLPHASYLAVGSILLLSLFTGYVGGSLRVASLASGNLAPLAGRSVEAELVITGPVRANAGWQSAAAVVRSLSCRGAESKEAWVGETVLLEVAPALRAPQSAGADALSAGSSREETLRGGVLEQGMIVLCAGTIKEPDGPSKSGYDQARQLLHQGIEVIVKVSRPEAVVVIGYRGGVSGWFDRLRAAAQAHLSLGPSRCVNEVLQGVVMGETQGIDEGWMNAFRRSGTAHMLSVSGLHVGSLAGLMTGLARLVGAPRGLGFLLAAISALFMIPFVGASPPIVRAAVMICVVLTGRWLGRGRDQWQVLGLAAVVVLALNPFAVFDVGFQLSFSAFLGMLTLLGPLRRMLRRLPEGLASNMAVSVAATLGTAPVSLAVFSTTSLVSPLANLLVVPTLPLITGMGMGSVFLGFIRPEFSLVLDTVASVPMMWTIQVSRLMAAAPVLTAGDLGRVLFALGMGLLALPAALVITGKGLPFMLKAPFPLCRRSLRWIYDRRPRRQGWACLVAVALLVVGLGLGGAGYPCVVRCWETVESLAPGRGWPREVELRVMDVGQGNAVLVRTPEHHTVLFDGGPAGCDLAQQLHDLGVRAIDLVVISHPHADHFAGLLEAVDDLKIGAVMDQVRIEQPPLDGVVSDKQALPAGAVYDGVSSGRERALAKESPQEAADYLELRRRLADKGCRYVEGANTCSVTMDEVLVRFSAPQSPLVLADGPDPWAHKGSEPAGDELNAASLVAVASVGSLDVLIPGDAEATTLERYELPPVDVLVVPHHGSAGAVSSLLLDKLKARIAVISVGKGNSFGHPEADTVADLEAGVGTVLRTDTCGWVSCRMENDAVVVTAERMLTQ